MVVVVILLVEDDPAVAELYRFRLEFDGHQVVVAPDGEVAVIMARQHRPRLIFLDIRLPKLDGLEVLAALKEDTELKTIPVVMLSNYGRREIVDQAMRLGAADFRIKSRTTPTELAQGVASWAGEGSPAEGPQ
jgi:CheY-like chemotaxis protein